MSIIFYSMGNMCGHCVAAERGLVAEMSSGQVIKKNSSEAPHGVNGFPHFTYNGVSSSGWGGKKNLFDRLGYKPDILENFAMLSKPYNSGYASLKNYWLKNAGI